MDGTKKRISRNIFPGDGRVNGERIRKVSGDMSCGSWMQQPTTLIRTGRSTGNSLEKLREINEFCHERIQALYIYIVGSSIRDRRLFSRTFI